MSTPLIDRPNIQPLLTLLKREGWAVPLFGLLFIRGLHGIPSAFHVIFGVRKSDIMSYEAVYSRHDLWVAHSGILSLLAAILLILTTFRWIRAYRITCVTKPTLSKTEAEQAAPSNR